MLWLALYIALIVAFCRAMPRRENNSAAIARSHMADLAERFGDAPHRTMTAEAIDAALGARHNTGGKWAKPLAFTPVLQSLHENGDSRG